MAKMVLDEYGFLEEPCLSCDKARTDDLFYEWYCDEKECPYTAKKERRRMTDFEMIVKEFCIPMENEFICDELCGWDVDEEDESWCSRNCGVTNCGKYPEMNCYKEWVKMKKSDVE